MLFIQGALLLASLSALAHGAAEADDLEKRFPAPGSTVTFWKDSSCPTDASASAMYAALLPSSGDDCTSGTMSLGWPTSSDNDDLQIAYYTASGLPDSCNLAILQQAAPQPSRCGSEILMITGGEEHTCRKGKLPKDGGFAICCNGSGNGCNLVNAKPKVKARNWNSTETRRAPTKDVTAVKRSGVLDRVNQLSKRSCTYSNSVGPFKSRGRQQTVSDRVSCPGGGDSCSQTFSTSVTTGSSNTFGVSDSVTAGGDFFVDIQDTISFSYMYTYSESQSYSQSTTVTIPAGESGVVTFTPSTSCVSGTFSGSCSWTTGSEKVACVPLYVSADQKQAAGTYRFVESG